MRPDREYVMTCEHVTEDVWSPWPNFVKEGDGARVIRCRACKWQGGTTTTGLVCDRWAMFRHEVEPDGFCAWGETRED